MQSLRKAITVHERELRRHPLFEVLAACESVDALGQLARALAWWPMVFQDVLRLTAQRVRGSELERFAEYDWDENTGHDDWYLQDLRVLGVEAPSFMEAFGAEFQPLRDACYALLAEVHRPQSGLERIAFLAALEPTGRVFFEQVAMAIERLCADERLLYFKRSHLVMERDHDLFAEATSAHLNRLVLSDLERTACESMVARVYQTFADVFSYLADCAQESLRTRSDVRELGFQEQIIPLGRLVRG